MAILGGMPKSATADAGMESTPFGIEGGMQRR